MRELPRILYIVELLLLALPTTFLAMVFGTYCIGRSWAPEAVSNFVILFLTLVGLLGFWILSISYLVAGRQGLMKAHWSMWGACGNGVIATASGLIAMAYGTNGEYQGFTWGIYGTPMLIPVTHLLSVRLFSNKAQQSS
ncbi:hypothetical protein H8K35_14660 [Undibacterium sp. LX40W]|uniref:Transmembrane protein n=1 Tax=Undibacterium nitidum TaxID=2762298 RepID=A0A923KTV4_9BURK|nr:MULTISPECIES: hypothetical protein [Undibacterium]MBC3882631.1 hypothetical protein [Undibacterium nitidum]MBC3892912.1 hypothetical protein [Undibacterium sp. LX40W]